MTPQEFLSITDNPNLIEGIYNYCDRWCERCTMTDRCSVFLTTPKLDPEDFPNEDAYMEASFSALRDTFQLTKDLIKHVADEKGIDLSDIEEEADDWEAKRQEMKSEVKNSPLSTLSFEYIQLGKAWLDNCKATIKDLEENLQHAALMGLPDRNPEQEALAVRDALEVIPYYLMQIHVKLNRAQTSRRSNDDWFEENEFPKDSDGSALVALIGIDNSIKAWGLLLQHLPQQEDSILPILSRLEHLRSLVETTFPDARAFKRPGFDD